MITARHVLGGLPNWRDDDLPLKTYFAPGERLSCSGQGFLYLRKATQTLTGEKMHDLAGRLVLQPIGMARSCFVWDWRFDQKRATPRDASIHCSTTEGADCRRWRPRTSEQKGFRFR